MYTTKIQTEIILVLYFLVLSSFLFIFQFFVFSILFTFQSCLHLGISGCISAKRPPPKILVYAFCMKIYKHECFK